MIFATILSLCTYASCNDYFIDKATTMADCQTNMFMHGEVAATVWHDDKALTAWLKTFEIVEPVRMLQDYDLTCKFIPDEQIP